MAVKGKQVLCKKKSKSSEFQVFRLIANDKQVEVPFGVACKFLLCGIKYNYSH